MKGEQDDTDNYCQQKAPTNEDRPIGRQSLNIADKGHATPRGRFGRGILFRDREVAPQVCECCVKGGWQNAGRRTQSIGAEGFSNGTLF